MSEARGQKSQEFIKKKRREIRERIFRDKSKYNVGKEGRLTGVTRKENVMKDKDDMDNVEDFFMSENESSLNSEDSETESRNTTQRKRRSITQPQVNKENAISISEAVEAPTPIKPSRKSSNASSSMVFDSNSILDDSAINSTNSSVDASPLPAPAKTPTKSKTAAESHLDDEDLSSAAPKKTPKATTKATTKAASSEKSKERLDKENKEEKAAEKAGSKKGKTASPSPPSPLDENIAEEEKKLSRKELRRLKSGASDKPIRDRKISISLSEFINNDNDNDDHNKPHDDDDRGDLPAPSDDYDLMIEDIIDDEEEESTAPVEKKTSKGKGKEKVKEKEKSKGKGGSSGGSLHYFNPPDSPFPSGDYSMPLHEEEEEEEEEERKEPKKGKGKVVNKTTVKAKKEIVKKETKKGKKIYGGNVKYTTSRDDSIFDGEDDSLLIENRLAEEEDSDFSMVNATKIDDDDDDELSDDVTNDFSILKSPPSLSRLANYKVELNNKTTAELRVELKKLKLEQGGNKAQMIDRILDHLSSTSSTSSSSSPALLRSPFVSSSATTHPLKSPKYQTPNRKYPKRKTRITPLEFWKNERVIYSRNKSGLKVVKEEDSDDEYLSSQPKKKIKTEPLIIPDSKVYNLQTKSYIPYGVAKSMDMMEMEPFSEDQEDLDGGVQKCEAFSFTDLKSGCVYIPPLHTTERQKPNKYHCAFYVQTGTLEVTVCKTTMKLVKGCHFFVPPGNHYEIKNLSPTHTAVVVYFHALFDV